MRNTVLDTCKARASSLSYCLTAYSGICAVGGVLDVPLPRHLLDNPSMLFFMGSAGVFVYSRLTQSDENKLLY